MASRYYDTDKANMFLGAIINQPRLLESPEASSLSESDFVHPMHKLMFGAISNLFNLGHSTMSPSIIENYIIGKPKAFAYFQEHGGVDYIEKLTETGEPGAFIPSLNHIKKLSLLRNLDNNGVDVSGFFDWDTKDEKTISAQRNWLETNDLIDIANEISDHIDIIMAQASGSQLRESIQAGEGLEELILELQKTPDFGSPLAIDMMNGIVRGGRLGKFYLRSAPTGGGKSRLAMADMAHFACDKIYDRYNGEWKENGVKEPALFITTELDLQECQTMALSYITGVDEEKILDGSYSEEEYKIVQEGVAIMNESPLYFEFIPDFSIREIESIIRTFYRENDVKYIA